MLALAGYAAAVLNNGLGRYEVAMEGAKQASEDGDFGSKADMSWDATVRLVP